MSILFGSRRESPSYDHTRARTWTSTCIGGNRGHRDSTATSPNNCATTQLAPWPQPRLLQPAPREPAPVPGERRDVAGPNTIPSTKLYRPIGKMIQKHSTLSNYLGSVLFKHQCQVALYMFILKHLHLFNTPVFLHNKEKHLFVSGFCTFVVAVVVCLLLCLVMNF